MGADAARGCHWEDLPELRGTGNDVGRHVGALSVPPTYPACRSWRHIALGFAHGRQVGTATPVPEWAQEEALLVSPRSR
jgi:hypothetical protein